MAPHVPPSVKRPFAGQVVRIPNAGEGVGRALRDQDAIVGIDKRYGDDKEQAQA